MTPKQNVLMVGAMLGFLAECETLTGQIYSRLVLMKNNEPKIVEKEKIVAEKLNGRFAMIGFIALVGAYLTTGQIIPGFI
ncbi:MAG: hypothetical protein CM15mP15_1630 [Prochlorococcus sp.]|nr:MAG: hypothetical protein CM15mP15_1630 [Prochlorococcus sp.]